MPQPKVPPPERINKSFKELTAISPELHSAAKELSKTVKELNAALVPLNLGITAWHTIASGEDDNGNYWSRSIGYTEVDHEWGIALRQASGNHHSDYHDEDVWGFAKAPRWMVIESVAKLPDLFETIIERVKETTTKLRARTDQAKELLSAIRSAAAELNAAKFAASLDEPEVDL
jgi:seryl-tRNA synthetase